MSMFHNMWDPRDRDRAVNWSTIIYRVNNRHPSSQEVNALSEGMRQRYGRDAKTQVTYNSEKHMLYFRCGEVRNSADMQSFRGLASQLVGGLSQMNVQLVYPEA